MIFKNNNCDLVCTGCELEAEPEKCINYFLNDIEAIKKQQQKNIANSTRALVEDQDKKFNKRSGNA